jgi:hypothetical protein
MWTGRHRLSAISYALRLHETAFDSAEDISVTVDCEADGYGARIKTTVGSSQEGPEVALLIVSWLDTKGQKVIGATELLSRQPSLQLKSLVPDTK